MQGRILLVTDDLETGRVWAFALGQRGLEVVLVGSRDEALEQWASEVFDLLLVDVHSPALDGLDLCRHLRSEAVVPFLLLIPQADEARSLEAYRTGVDECVEKPISPALLVAKVTAWLGRSWTVQTDALQQLEAGDLRLDPGRREVTTVSGAVVKLTNLEFRLLHLLMTHPGQVLEGGQIVDRVWGYAGGAESVLLKNLVYRLRQKIEPEPSSPRYIQTMPGEGYTFGWP